MSRTVFPMSAIGRRSVGDHFSHMETGLEMGRRAVGDYFNNLVWNRLAVGDYSSHMETCRLKIGRRAVGDHFNILVWDRLRSVGDNFSHLETRLNS